MSDRDEPASAETAPAGDAAESTEAFARLLQFIAESRSIDFSEYKTSSLTRRISKRMQDVGARDYDDYRDLLETDADEFRWLIDTVFINVTSFFRDAPAWEHLQQEVVPDLLEHDGSGGAPRLERRLLVRRGGLLVGDRLRGRDGGGPVP